MQRRHAVLLIAIIAVSAIAGHAQQTPVFRTSADIVQIDVSVLDRDHQPVRGLSAADFTVLDSGIEQPVVAFAAVDLPDRVRTGAPWTHDVAPDVVTNHLGAKRVVLIVFDDCSTPWDPSVLQLSRHIARAAVDELGPQDLASVIYTSARRNGQELTTDRARLTAAVERFFPQSPAGSPPPGPFSASVPTRGLASPAAATAGLRSGNCLAGSEGSPLDQALRNGAEILSAWPGVRKTVILVSTSSVDFSQMTLDHNVIVDNLARTFAAMQRANLNVYQFDPRGLEVGRKISEEFGILSDNTGGRAFMNTNTPWEGVPQVFRENSSYYLVGFRPTNVTQDGRFRKITVKVSRPGLEVRTRAGYYSARAEKPAKPSNRPVPTEIERALSNGLPTGDVPLALSVVAVPVARGKNPAVAVVAGLSAIEDAPPVEKIEVTAAAFTDTWKSAGTATQTIEVARRGGATGRVVADVPIRLDLKPGRYEIRFAAQSAATERTGSVYASLTVPDFAKAALALSGVQIIRNNSGSSEPAASGSLPWPVGVTTRRAFRNDEAVAAEVRVSQIGARHPAVVTVTAVIQDRDGGELSRDTRELPVELFATNRIVEHRTSLPLLHLHSGEYLLTFDARTGNQIERSFVRFTVDGL